MKYIDKMGRSLLGRKKLVLCTASAISVLGMTGSAAAQESKGYSIELEEIVVTAQKREQGIMDTPVTVNAFTAQDIVNTGALSIQDIDDFLPGVDIGDDSQSSTQSGISIRGISSPNISSGGDPSVATFYDEAYVPRAATTIPFTDIARVEVLKGPQGTLFGRNATAGVINMVPNAPAEEFDAFVKVRAGNYNHQRLEGMLNFAASDSIFIRANALSSTRDGYNENVGIGPDTDDEDVQTFRLSALFNISEATSLQLSYDLEDRNEAATTSIGVSKYAYGAVIDPATGASSVDPTRRVTSNDVEGARESRDMSAFSAKLNHQISDQWSLFAISSFRQWETFNLQDDDGTSDINRYFDTNNIEDSDINYNELRFHFEGDKTNIIFGANYSKEDIFQRTDTRASTDSWGYFWGGPGGLDLGGGSFDVSTTDLNVFGAVSGQPLLPFFPETIIDQVYLGVSQAIAPLVGFVPPLLPPRFNGQFWTESIENTGVFENFGVFVDGTYELNESMRIAAGLRYSKDEKEYTWQTFPVADQIDFPTVRNLIYTPPNDDFRKYEAQDDWSEVTGRLVYSWDISDDAMFYATYATGYKSGGFDGQSFDLLSFAPETIENIELGLKGDFFNNRMRIEGAIFKQDLQDRQQSVSLIPEGSSVAKPSVIGGDQDIEGIEIILSYAVLDTLRIGFNTTVRDTESIFERYIDAAGNPAGGVKSKSSADNDWALRADWTPQISKGSLLVHVDYVFDEFTSAFDDSLQSFINAGLISDGPWYQDDQKKLSARVAWLRDDDKLEVALWGDNLLDEDHADNPGGFTASTTGASLTRLNAPRTWGVDLRYSF